jgi:hypothetical protein
MELFKKAFLGFKLPPDVPRDDQPHPDARPVRVPAVVLPPLDPIRGQAPAPEIVPPPISDEERYLIALKGHKDKKQGEQTMWGSKLKSSSRIDELLVMAMKLLNTDLAKRQFPEISKSVSTNFGGAGGEGSARLQPLQLKEKKSLEPLMEQIRVMTQETGIYAESLWFACKAMVGEVYYLSDNISPPMMSSAVLKGDPQRLSKLLHVRDLEKVIDICEPCLKLYALHSKLQNIITLMDKVPYVIPPETGSRYIEFEGKTSARRDIYDSSRYYASVSTSDVCLDILVHDRKIFYLLSRSRRMSWMASVFCMGRLKQDFSSSLGYYVTSFALFAEGMSFLDADSRARIQWTLKLEPKIKTEVPMIRHVRRDYKVSKMFFLAFAIDIRWAMVLVLWHAKRLYPELSRHLHKLQGFVHAVLRHHECILAMIRPILANENRRGELWDLRSKVEDKKVLLTPCLEFLFVVAQTDHEYSDPSCIFDSSDVWSVAWGKMWTKTNISKWRGIPVDVLQRQCLRELGVLCVAPNLSIESLKWIKALPADEEEVGKAWEDGANRDDHPLNGALNFQPSAIQAGLKKTIRYDTKFHQIITDTFVTGEENGLFDFDPYGFFKTTFDVPPLLDIFFKGANRTYLDIIRGR